jgi:outer membrane receptor protein involved in Fe transport
MSKTGKRTDLFGAGARAAITLALGVGGVVIASPDAFAQATSNEDEIIVTATRRDQALQDVPIAVTPVTAEMIEHSGIRDIQDLTSVAPSLQFNVSESESSATARLRGVGTQGSNPGLESAVGIFVDGVYRARNGVALTDLGEVQQIEVLRGPQGTLFGRNTSAGLITINTVAPDLSEFSVTGEGTYGDFGETRVSGSINVPLAEDVAGIRLFAARATRDGFLDMNAGGQNTLLGAASHGNQSTGEANDRDVYTLRGQFAWQISSDADFRFIADYTERNEFCCAAQIYNPLLLNGNQVTNLTLAGVETANANTFGGGRMQWVANLGGYGPNVSALTPLGALGAGNIGDRQGFANRTYDQNIEDYGASGQLNWDIGIGDLTIITAYRQWTSAGGSDSDYSQADIVYVPQGADNHTQFQTFTQEARLAGEWGRLNWLVGGFYSNERINRAFSFLTGSQYAQYFAGLDNVLVGGAQTPGLGNTPGAGASAVVNNLYDELFTGPTAMPAGAGTGGSVDTYHQDGRSIAFFTHNIFALTDHTDLTFGARFTHETKDLTATFHTLYNGQAAFTAAMAQAATQTAQPSLATFNNCNTALQPAPALATVVAVARSGYCVPWMRTELDGVGYNQHRGEDQWSGVVAIRQEFTDRLSGYLSASRGYKGGGFNLDRNFSFVTAGGSPNTAFDAELVDAYEAGVKSGWFGGALLLNLAVYHNEYENFQLNTFNGIQFVVTTVPQVTVDGAEVDAIWRTPIEGLSFQGGVAYNDATYGEDNGWVAANRNPITGEPTLARLPGSQLTNSPLYTVTTAFTYQRPVFNDSMNLLAYIDARYADDQNTGSDLRPSKEQPSYTLVNGRIGLSTADERLSFEIWGRNLFDEEYAQIMFDVPLQQGTQGPTEGAFLGDPRTFGATVRVRY